MGDFLAPKTTSQIRNGTLKHRVFHFTWDPQEGPLPLSLEASHRLQLIVGMNPTGPFILPGATESAEAQLFGPIWSDMSESKSSNTPTVIQPVYDLHQISINYTGWIYIYMYISMIIHINIHLDRAWLPLNYRVHSPTPVIFPSGDDKPKLRPQAS